MVLWAYSSCISLLTAPRVGGSNLGPSSFFVGRTNRALADDQIRIETKRRSLPQEAKTRRRGIPRRKGKAGAARRERRTGRRIRNGYEKCFRFELAIRLNGKRQLED